MKIQKPNLQTELYTDIDFASAYFNKSCRLILQNSGLIYAHYEAIEMKLNAETENIQSQLDKLIIGKAEKEESKKTIDYSKYRIPINQLKFNRDEINERK